MRCFYHEDKEAVGACKSCGKGLACRGHCETDAQALIQLINRNIQLSSTLQQSKTIQTNNKMRSATGILSIASGAAFFVLAQHNFERLKIFAFIGAVFIAYGVYVQFLSYGPGKK
jgi:hypothetical protein